MLGSRAGAGDQEHEGKGCKSRRRNQRHEAERGHDRADRQQPAFAEPLGEQAGRHLGGGERARIAGLEDAGRRERQAELRLPDRQQDEDHVREAVVQEMDRAGGREHRPPPASLVVLDYGPGSGEHGADLRL